jgi:hypothetical protein
LVIAKNVHEQVFVMQEFALLLQVQLVSQLVQELLVQQLEQELLVQPQPLVLVVFHHVVRLQLVHLLKKMKKMNPKNLGYMF